VAGGLPSTIPVYIILTEGAPSLRSLQEPALSLSKGWVAMLPTQLLFFPTKSVAHAFVVPALCKLRKGRGTRICGGFCSLKAGPPAPPTLRFPERTGVALRSDLAHDNHQNSNFLFRLH